MEVENLSKLISLYDEEKVRKMCKLCRVVLNELRPFMDRYEEYKEAHQELVNPECVYRHTFARMNAILVHSWNACVFAERKLIFHDYENWVDFCEYYTFSVESQGASQLFDIMKSAGIFEGMRRSEYLEFK